MTIFGTLGMYNRKSRLADFRRKGAFMILALGVIIFVISFLMPEVPMKKSEKELAAEKEEARRLVEQEVEEGHAFFRRIVGMIIFFGAHISIQNSSVRDHIAFQIHMDCRRGRYPACERA